MATIQRHSLPDGLGLYPLSWDIVSGKPLDCERNRFGNPGPNGFMGVAEEG
jgi:hypothetical protein